MPHLARFVALAACLALTGSVAHAAPGKRDGRHRKAKKRAKQRIKAIPQVDQISASDEDRDDDDAADDVAFASQDADDEPIDEYIDVRDDLEVDKLIDPPAKRRKRAATRARDWHVAIGPYVWASSVDADVSLGSESVSTGIDFFELQRHTRFGAEVLAEARYGRFSIVGDLMYGVIDVSGQREVGPFMVRLDGTASSLLLDGAAGYLLAGDSHSLLSLEVRGGVRYQRTAISGSLGIAGSALTPAEKVMAGADALAGARVFLQPHRRFYLAGAADLGLFGSSTSTWSASADASVRVTSYALLSLGWRTLTTNSAYVSVVMHGPRVAVQVVF